MCTNSPEINVARIAKRYMNGGHEVPISKVVTRYFKSLEYAKEAIEFVDRAYIYDNSVDDHLPELLYVQLQAHSQNYTSKTCLIGLKF